MKQKIFIVLLQIIFLAANQEAHSQLRNLTMTSYEIVSYNITSGKLTLNLTIRNDSTSFTINSFSGLIKQKKDSLIHLTAANLFIPHGESSIGVVCMVSRCPGVSLFRLARCLINHDIRDYSVDISVAVQYPFCAIEYKELNDVPLSTHIVQQ